jgi:hypothetical protein
MRCLWALCEIVHVCVEGPWVQLLAWSHGTDLYDFFFFNFIRVARCIKSTHACHLISTIIDEHGHNITRKVLMVHIMGSNLAAEQPVCGKCTPKSTVFCRLEV